MEPLALDERAALATRGGAGQAPVSRGLTGLFSLVFVAAYLGQYLGHHSGLFVVVWFGDAILAMSLKQTLQTDARRLMWQRLGVGILALAAAAYLSSRALWTSLTFAVLCGGESFLAAWLLQRLRPPDERSRSETDVWELGFIRRLLLSCGLLAPIASASLATLLWGRAPAAVAAMLWLSWFTSAGLGYLLVVPLHFSATRRELQALWQGPRLRQGLALLSLFLPALLLIFARRYTPLALLVLPLSLLAIVSVGESGAILSMLACGLIGLVVPLFPPQVGAFWPADTARMQTMTLQLVVTLQCAMALLGGSLLHLLRANEERYRRLFDASPLPTLVFAADSLRILAANSAAEACYGLTQAEFLARHVADLLPDKDTAALQRCLQQSQGQTLAGEAVHRRKSGETFAIFGAASPLVFEGRPAQVLSIQDISERKRAEQQLRELHEFHQKILDFSPIGIAAYDESGQNLLANQAMARIAGLTPEQKRQQNFRQLSSWQSSGMLEVAERVLHTGQAEREEFHLRTTGGKEVWVACAFSTFVEAGKRRLLLLAEDVSVRERDRAEIAQVRRDLSHVLDSTPIPITYWDRTLQNRFANRAYLRTIGREASDITGLSMQEVLGAAYCERMRPQVEEVLRGGAPAWESAVELPQGRRQLLLQYHPDVVGDHVRGFLVTVIDISTQKQAEERAQEASRAKSDFLANMSHEIRTPLSAVLGYTTLLLDTQLSREQAEYVQSARIAADALLSQLNTILDLAKIEAGQMEVASQPTDLRAALDDAVEILADLSRKKKLWLTALCEPDCPAWVMTDAGRLRQVLINLLGNAIKFTDQGEITARVRRLETEQGAVLRFTVTDTGVGIPSEARHKLFLPFSQVDSSITRRYQGTGLGLSLSRSLVQALGGEIGLDSPSGPGTTVWFTLPLRPVAPGPGESRQLPSRLSGCRALVVDGRALRREQLGQLLSGMQLCPILCQDAQQARAALGQPQERPLVVALLSEDGAQGAGQAFAAELHRMPGLASLPILALPTGFEAEPPLSERADFTGRLGPPLRQRQLLQWLQDLLGAPSHPGSQRPVRRHISSPFEGSQGSPRILLADDDPANQRLTMLMLQRLGCQVDPASTGQQALSAARGYPYDLIILDCQMPELDGLAATQEIRRLPPPHSQVPIIALTANAFEEDRQRCLAAGMNDFLIKPVSIDSLSQALRRWGRKPTTPLGSVVPLASPASAAPAVPTPELSSDLDSIHQRLSELAELLDPKASDELLLICKRTWPKEVSAARAQLQQEAYATLGETLHRLAGSALQVGARQLGQRCLGLETDLKASLLPAPAVPLPAAHIGERIDQVEQLLSQLLSRL